MFMFSMSTVSLHEKRSTLYSKDLQSLSFRLETEESLRFAFSFEETFRCRLKAYA